MVEPCRSCGHPLGGSTRWMVGDNRGEMVQMPICESCWQAKDRRYRQWKASGGTWRPMEHRGMGAGMTIVERAVGE